MTVGPRVVVFGESENDRKAIAELIRALCPDSQVKAMRNPLVLIKGAKPADVPDRAEQIADAVRAESVRQPVDCVFAHEDADDVEPAHAAITAKIESALSAAGLPAKSFAVVPAWELESWWFLWPEEVAQCYGSWVKPTSRTSPGRIRNAKEELGKAVRPKGLRSSAKKKFPDYRESDSIKIAERIREAKVATKPAVGTSASYDAFRIRVAQCCAHS